MFFIFCIFLNFAQADLCSGCVRVALSTGVIEGSLQTATYSPFGSQTAIQFLGIPFAAPPIGDLRFEKPQKPDYRTGILETKKYSAACMSDPSKTFKNRPLGVLSEDCLYLNVFTNEYCMKNQNCSVMLVFHGGAFITESASSFNGDIMINNFVGQGRNIVVVTPNYRLGVFGFANYPGVQKNLGLFDALEALKWTHREIHAFGGLPNRITLAGHSAGGSIVAALTLSPLSRGLVHQQILMSPPLYDRFPTGNVKYSEKISEVIGCAGGANLTCLRNVSTEQMFAADEYVSNNTTMFFEGMMVDGDIVTDYMNRVLEKQPERIHKVSTMIGTTLAELRNSLYCQDEQGNVIFTRLEQLCDHVAFEYSFVDQIEFRNRCISRYSNQSMAQFFSDDVTFYSMARKFAAVHTSPNTNVYLYSYNYKGAGDAFDKYKFDIPSPTHSEDLIYVFGTHRKADKMTHKDYEIERIYSGIFADFVNFGKPRTSSKWEPFKEPEASYFEIDFDQNLKMPGPKTNYYQEAHQFWNVDVVRDFEKVYLSSSPPSANSFVIDDRLRVFQSHYKQKPAVAQIPLEIWEQLYYEFEDFLTELKLKYHPSYKSGNIAGSESVEGIAVFDIFFTSTWESSDAHFSSLLSTKHTSILISGTIEGSFQTATYSPFGSQTAIQFLGIPFAAPPISDLRFRKPQKVANWTGILETKKYSPACMSDPSRTFKNRPIGMVSEDCLYLNVFSNEYCMKNQNCSVMLVLHGGGLITESASSFNGDIMINNFVGQGRNIVVVTPNYRLGVFGFANYPGVQRNLGLFDALEALKWTHYEIQAFGGLPNRITLAGHSAGGSIVAALTLSPLSRGLVHQQILMSPPLYDRFPTGNVKYSEKISEVVGCAGGANLTCLRNVSTEQMFAADEYVSNNTTMFFEGMMVDGDIVTDYMNRVLEKQPERIHKVSTMIGTTLAELRNSLYCQDEQGNVIFTRLEQLCDHVAFEYSFVDQIEFRNRCISRYSNQSMAQFFSDDVTFYSMARKFAAVHTSPNTNVYLYSYNYKGAGDAFDKYKFDIPSPTHSEDLIYVFGTHRKADKMTHKDYEIERIYSGIFADFVNFGKPRTSSKWEPFKEPEASYFEIDFDQNLKMPGPKTNYYQEAHQFWNVDVVRDFEKVYLSSSPPSANSFVIDDRLRVFQSHYKQKPAVAQIPLEIWEQLYYEFEDFLTELKLKYHPSYKSGNIAGSESVEGIAVFDIFFYIYLGIIGCSLLFIALHQTYIYFNVQNKRNGYVLLRE